MPIAGFFDFMIHKYCETEANYILIGYLDIFISISPVVIFGNMAQQKRNKKVIYFVEHSYLHI